MVNKILVISGSTISGLTEAILYFLNWVTISVFVVFVNVEPDAAFTATLTTP